MAIFPAFTDPEKPLWPQSFYMLLSYVFVATVVHSAIAFLGDAASRHLMNDRKMNSLRRFLSFSLFFVALWFAWATRIKGG